MALQVEEGVWKGAKVQSSVSVGIQESLCGWHIWWMAGSARRDDSSVHQFHMNKLSSFLLLISPLSNSTCTSLPNEALKLPKILLSPNYSRNFGVSLLVESSPSTLPWISGHFGWFHGTCSLFSSRSSPRCALLQQGDHLIVSHTCQGHPCLQAFADSVLQVWKDLKPLLHNQFTFPRDPAGIPPPIVSFT